MDRESVASYKRAVYQRVTPDIVGTNGPWMSEFGAVSPVDNVPDDGIIDNLPATHVFTLENIQSAEQAAKAQIDKVAPDAPIILVVGYEPHVNAREAFDLLETGLSEQQISNPTSGARATMTFRSIGFTYGANGKLIAVDSGEKIDVAANVEKILTASVLKSEEAASYKVLVWTDKYEPLTTPLEF